MMHWDGYGWGMGFGWVVMILFWVLVIAASVLLVRGMISYGEKKGQRQQSQDTALDILKKRYAKGEITRDEYERMKTTSPESLSAYSDRCHSSSRKEVKPWQLLRGMPDTCRRPATEKR